MSGYKDNSADLDHSFPAARLPVNSTSDHIVQHFQKTFGVRVDVSDLPPDVARASTGARIPDPAEAMLLDRILQIIPLSWIAWVDRIIIVDNGETARDGSYLSRTVFIRTPALNLRLRDPEFSGKYSRFTVTVLHKIGHAVYQSLTRNQRQQVTEHYLDTLIGLHEERLAGLAETAAEHHFVNLCVAALLKVRYGDASPRHTLDAMGITVAWP